MPRAKICRGVMAKRSIPDQVMNDGSIAHGNMFKELYASNSDITLTSTTQNPIKKQVIIFLIESGRKVHHMDIQVSLKCKPSKFSFRVFGNNFHSQDTNYSARSRVL